MTFLATLVELVVVINMNLEGEPTASVVKLEAPQPKEFIWLTCVREFGAPAIRCYAVNPDNMELRHTDYDLK